MIESHAFKFYSILGIIFMCISLLQMATGFRFDFYSEYDEADRHYAFKYEVAARFILSLCFLGYALYLLVAGNVDKTYSRLFPSMVFILLYHFILKSVESVAQIKFGKVKKISALTKLAAWLVVLVGLAVYMTLNNLMMV